MTEREDLVRKIYTIFFGAIEETLDPEKKTLVTNFRDFVGDAPSKKKSGLFIDWYVSPLGLDHIDMLYREEKRYRAIFGKEIYDTLLEYAYIYKEEVFSKMLELMDEREIPTDIRENDFEEAMARVTEKYDDDGETYAFILDVADESVSEWYLKNGSGKFRVRIELDVRENNDQIKLVCNTDAPDFRKPKEVLEKIGQRKVTQYLKSCRKTINEFSKGIENCFYLSRFFPSNSPDACEQILNEFTETVTKQWNLFLPYKLVADHFAVA